MLRLLLCCVLLMLAACTPKPPEKERPVEPQAHAELRDAIQAPIERAKAVDAQVDKAAEEQRQAIEDAGG